MNFKIRLLLHQSITGKNQQVILSDRFSVTGNSEETIIGHGQSVLCCISANTKAELQHHGCCLAVIFVAYKHYKCVYVHITSSDSAQDFVSQYLITHQIVTETVSCKFILRLVKSHSKLPSLLVTGKLVLFKDNHFLN